MMKKMMLLLCCAALLCACAGCGEKEAVVPSTANVSLQELVARHIPDVDQMMPMPLTDLEDYLGIEAAWYTEALYLQENTLGGNEVLMLRAKDTESGNKIENCLKGYLEQRMKETQNYLPEAYKVLKETGVQRNNNTLTLIVTQNAKSISNALLAGE